MFVSLPERGPAPADDWRSSDIVLEAPKWTYMAATKKWSDVYPDEAADEIWGRPKEPDTAVIRRFRFAFEVDDGGEAQVAGHAHLSHRGAGRMTRISDFAGTNRTNRAIMASDVHAAV